MFAYVERMLGERTLQTLATVCLVGWWAAVIVEAVWQGRLEGAAGEESLAGVMKATLALGVVLGLLYREARGAAALAAGASVVWVTVYVVAYSRAFGDDFFGFEGDVFLWFLLMIVALPLMVGGSMLGWALRRSLGAVARRVAPGHR